MAGPKPTVDYQPFNSTASGVPDVESPRRDEFTVHASPEAFGAQIGGALEQTGKTIEGVAKQGADIATEFGAMATSAKAEDDFSNKYATGAAKLRQNFDALDDKDKIAGSADYLSGLHQLGQQFMGDDAPNPYYKQMMGQLIGRHIFAETTGIDKEVVEATHRAAADAKDNLMMTNAGYAAQNYDNSDVVNQMSDSIGGLQVLKHTDLGHDPTDPQSAALINEAHKNFMGNVMAPGMINAAVSDGNLDAAHQIRQDYSPAIPGFRQLQIDNFLHSASMQQFGSSGNSALASGQPLPQVPGAPHSDVQSIVANTAHANGVDPNEALTVARIESSYGENVGSRGTIGQDKGSAGQPLDAQAKALCDNWKAAKQPAADALGRTPEGWEQYTVYQQGSGGGAALLKADPNAKAVDVLNGVYSSPKLAMEAITKNGGNATMTVSDFLDQEKKRYNDNFDRAKCDFTGNTPPGNQITDAHEKSGVTVQPGANPMEDYRNWQKAGVVNMQNIMAMPSGPARQALMEDFKQKTAMRESAATAYKSQIVSQAFKYIADPKVTSMDQIPPQFAADLYQNDPQAYNTLQNRMTEKASKVDPAAKEALEKGAAFHDLNVGTQDGAGRRTTVDDINQAYNSGQINSSAQDYLISKISGKRSMSPEEETYKNNSREYAKAQLMFDSKMPETVAAYSNFSMAFDSYVDDAKAKGVSTHDIYDVKEGSSLDKLVKSFEPDYSDMMPKAKPDQGGSHFIQNLFGAKRTLNDVMSDASKVKNDPAKLKQYMQEARTLGWQPGPSVPVAQ